MKLSEKEKREMREKRKLLNKAWDAGKGFGGENKYRYGATYIPPHSFERNSRYRDVTKILKEAEKEKNHVKV